MSAPPPGGGCRRGGTVPPPAALGSNGLITDAAKTSVHGLVHSAQTVVRLVRERSAYTPGLRKVDYGCFDGQLLIRRIRWAAFKEALRCPWKRGVILITPLSGINEALTLAPLGSG